MSDQEDEQPEYDKFGLECFIKTASCMFVQGMLNANKTVDIPRAVNLAFELEHELNKRFKNKI